MERKLTIVEGYLYIPICAGKEEKKLEIFLESQETSREKIYELLVPVDETKSEEYVCDYYAEIPVKQYLGRQLVITAEAPQSFGNQIKNEKKQGKVSQDRPVIHFTADTGWTNDPNGLVYADGLYHLYFQYNPFNVSWNNMSWGHAVSTDLIHWEQKDTVMFPDESGTMFSGCAIINEQGMLGLPADALLFYYTAAGGSNEWSRGLDFTQKIAYSLDGGETLTKINEPCLPALFKENRDPKVYWHEESHAYVMALWLQENDFAIFRSEDLKHWEQSDRFSLKDAWECPDLFHLTSEEGDTCWFFWSADGFCYPGEFDGYRFQTHGVRRHAYVNGIPYAAQTYYGVADRVISIPWLRINNDGRLFTGSYGIPVELSCRKAEDGFLLIQKPVRELMQHAKQAAWKVEHSSAADENGRIFYKGTGSKKAIVVEMLAEEIYKGRYTWEVNGSVVEYNSQSGQLTVDEDSYQIGCGYKEFLLIVDDRILEIFFDGGVQLGTFILRSTNVQFQASCEAMEKYVVYEIE